MSVRFAVLTAALTDTDWHRFSLTTGSASNGFASVGPNPELGPNDRIVRLRPLSVTDNICSLYLGERVGNATGGTAGIIQIPAAAEFPQLDGCTLTLGNQVLTFRHFDGASAGTLVCTFNKTRAQIVAEVVVLLTAITTGIADLEVADAEEDGIIALQSDAGSVVQATWSLAAHRSIRLFAEGLSRVRDIPLAVGTYTAVHEIDLRNSDVRAISLRGAANPCNALFLAEVQELATSGVR